MASADAARDVLPHQRLPPRVLLERRAAALSSCLGQGRFNLRVAQREFSEATSQRDRLTEQLMTARRQCRLSAASRADAEAALEAAHSAHKEAVKDNAGLQRTLDRFQHRSEVVTTEVKKEKEVVIEAEGEDEMLRIQEVSLRQEVDGLRSIGERLQRRTTLEREKRLLFKASARLKLERCQEGVDALRRAAEESRGVADEIRRRLVERRDAEKAAAEEVFAKKRELVQVKSRVVAKIEDIRRLEAELTLMKRAEVEIHQELETLREVFAEYGRQRKEAQQTWCLQYMEKSSSRATRFQRADQEILVA